MSTTNTARKNYLLGLAAANGPARFALGERVIVDFAPNEQVEGVIDMAFADMAAAIDARIVDQAWYDSQERRPKSSREDRWYGVILDDGAVLVGELDLHKAPAKQ